MKITWTEEKESQLLKMRKQGMSYDTIADMFGGTPNAVRVRYYRLPKIARQQPVNLGTEQTPSPPPTTIESLVQQIVDMPIAAGVSKQITMNANGSISINITSAPTNTAVI